MTDHETSIPWPGKSAITVQVTAPPKGTKHSGFALVLGPGAGGDEKQALLTSVAHAVAKEGHFCVRYRAKVPNLVAGTVAEKLSGKTLEEAPSSPPEKKAKKNKTKTEVEDNDGSQDYPSNFIKGLVLFSYPLQGANNTVRDQILLDIPATIPTLMISGLKDTMCQPAVFSKVFQKMTSSPREVVQVEGADHGLGFGSAKSTAGKKEALISAIADWTIQFMDESISQENGAKSLATGKGIAIKKKAEVKKAEVEGEWIVATSDAS
ncbi:Testis-expressed protein 30 [Podila epigama]|nr:Testis-expressed protein 30 [Podila epigama]